SWNSRHQTLDPLNTHRVTRAPGRNLSLKVPVRVLRSNVFKQGGGLFSKCAQIAPKEEFSRI
ncbi:MAG: hypothetical protein ACPGK1_12025, partial [bacterium]